MSEQPPNTTEQEEPSRRPEYGNPMARAAAAADSIASSLGELFGDEGIYAHLANLGAGEFTEEWFYETETDIPDNKYVIDWEATWNSYLRFDFTRHYDEAAGKTWFFWANA